MGAKLTAMTDETGSYVFSYILLRPPRPALSPYTTLFRSRARPARPGTAGPGWGSSRPWPACRSPRSEEHTSELQSHSDLVCRLLLEKKKTVTRTATN